MSLCVCVCVCVCVCCCCVCVYSTSCVCLCVCCLGFMNNCMRYWAEADNSERERACVCACGALLFCVYEFQFNRIHTYVTDLSLSLCVCLSRTLSNQHVSNSIGRAKTHTAVIKICCIHMVWNQLHKGMHRILSLSLSLCVSLSVSSSNTHTHVYIVHLSSLYVLHVLLYWKWTVDLLYVLHGVLSLTKMLYLDISRNLMVDFPNVILLFTKLRTLRIFDNPFGVLPANISVWTDLLYLDASFCGLTSFPQIRTSWLSLEYIDLAYQQLSQFPLLPASIKIAELTSNLITRLPTDINVTLPNLITLAMAFNNLTFIPDSLPASLFSIDFAWSIYPYPWQTTAGIVKASNGTFCCISPPIPSFVWCHTMTGQPACDCTTPRTLPQCDKYSPGVCRLTACFGD